MGLLKLHIGTNFNTKNTKIYVPVNRSFFPFYYMPRYRRSGRVGTRTLLLLVVIKKKVLPTSTFQLSRYVSGLSFFSLIKVLSL